MAQAIPAAVLMCILIIAMATGPSSASVTCGTVASRISGCINYTKVGGRVPPACCTGMKTLNSEAHTTPDRKQTCLCLMDIIHGITGVKSDLVSGLPGKCGVDISFPFTPTTDCSKIR